MSHYARDSARTGGTEVRRALPDALDSRHRSNCLLIWVSRRMPWSIIGGLPGRSRRCPTNSSAQ